MAPVSKICHRKAMKTLDLYFSFQGFRSKELYGSREVQNIRYAPTNKASVFRLGDEENEVCSGFGK